MEKTEKFFIFTWKEVLVISLLVLTLVGFFFTLGLHYGKRIAPPVVQTTDIHEEEAKIEEGPETLPPREALEAGSEHAKAVTTETIKEATQEEVEHNEVKLDQQKAVALPAEKSEPKSASGAFSIQLGSYTTKKEASSKVRALTKKGLNAEIAVAEVNHVTRYRVVIPGFKSKAAADQQGRELKKSHKIDNFIVIK